MKTKYGLFRLNTESRYIQDGYGKFDLVDKYESEESARISLNWQRDGYYIVIQMYHRTEEMEAKMAEEEYNPFRRRSNG